MPHPVISRPICLVSPWSYPNRSCQVWSGAKLALPKANPSSKLWAEQTYSAFMSCQIQPRRATLHLVKSHLVEASSWSLRSPKPTHRVSFGESKLPFLSCTESSPSTIESSRSQRSCLRQVVTESALSEGPSHAPRKANLPHQVRTPSRSTSPSQRRSDQRTHHAQGGTYRDR